MIRRFFIAINIILFILSLFFLIKTATDKKQINRYYGEKFSYTETGAAKSSLRCQTEKPCDCALIKKR